MRKGKLMGKIFGIILVFVMIGSMIGALGDVAEAQAGPIAEIIDNELLYLIDRYASKYYNDTWDLTLNQYKAWIATIAWGEGGRGGYTAHSQSGCRDSLATSDWRDLD